QPRRDVGGPATEIDRIEPRNVGQESELGLRMTSAPNRLRSSPRISSSFNPVRGVLIPRGSIHANGVVGHRTTRTWGAAGPLNPPSRNALALALRRTFEPRNHPDPPAWGYVPGMPHQ